MKHEKFEQKKEEIQEKIIEIMKHSAQTYTHSQRAFWLPISFTLMVLLIVGGIIYLCIKFSN